MLSIALVADGNELLSYSNDGYLKLWNLVDRLLIADMVPQIRTSPRFMLDAVHKVVLGINHGARPQLWHLHSPAEGLALVGHSTGVSKLLLSRDGKIVVSAAGSEEIFVWDTLQGELLNKLPGHHAPVDALLLNDPLNRLVSAAHDGSIKVWDLASGQLMHTLAGHSSWITHLRAADRDGRILSVDGSGKIYLWDIESALMLASFEGHIGNVSSLIPRPDANALVTAGSDKSVRVWRLDGGEQLARYQLDQRPVNLIFSGEVNDIVVSDAGGAVHFLRMRTI